MANPINYDPNTPTKQLSFADWQVQFIKNFTKLGEAFATNHVPLDDPIVANRGNHTYINLSEQINDPQTSIAEFSVYVKDVQGQTDQVFFTFPGNTPIVQFTNYQIYSVQSTAKQTTFFTFLPGGILIYFGTFGPFNDGPGGGNTLFLNPPIAKNIVSVNLCHQGTTPKYTPAAVEETLGTVNPDFTFNFSKPGIIKELYLIPTIPSKNNTVFYFVVANT